MSRGAGCAAGVTMHHSGDQGVTEQQGEESDHDHEENRHRRSVRRDPAGVNAENPVDRGLDPTDNFSFLDNYSCR
ncbi:hypothetical protein ACQP1O_24180 [Nocardia sp. CA-151230]|uniref:hypothetical protein n=1 Tax=Nocardia sp. CA-151230 TaxID=3239982 RepID=UPI003D905C3A